MYNTIVVVKDQKKSPLKYYQMVLRTIKNLLSIRTLPSSGIKNWIKI